MHHFQINCKINIIFFFWIGNQKSYIREEKNKCEVQDVHHDEQKEIIEHSTQ